MLKSRSGIVILSLLLAAIVTSCGKSPSETDKNGMVLRHIMPTKVRGLDPGDMRDRYSITIGSQIFETLYQYHFLKRPYEIVPLLAEAMPLVSDDLLTYTIKIQSGIYYQDDKCFPGGKGRELKARDFVYSLKRIANIKYLSQNWSLFDDKIVGLDEFREYTKGCKSAEDIDYSRPVEGLETPDDYTLVIKLQKPWPQMVSTALADLATAPVAREAVDFYGKDIISHPVGTGPFMLEQWRRGSYFELLRNPNFRGEPYPSEGEPGDAEKGYLDDAGKIMPFADKVIWTVILESQPAWFLFLEGKVDSSGIPKDNFGEAITQNMELTESMKQRNIHLKTFLDPSTFWVGFNMLDLVLGKNKPLRLAISRSINREKFIELFSNNRDMVAHGMVVPLMDSYNSDIKDEGYSKYDPEEAKELIQEAEKINGGKLPVLKLAVPGTDTFARQYGQYLVRQMTNIGLEVEAQYMDWPTYLEKMNARSLQMFTSGAHASIIDAQDFLQSFYTRNWAPGANNFNYSNAEFDRLYEQAVVKLDGPERRRLYREMEKIALDDCPAAFLNHRVAYVLHHDWYKNYKPHAFAYGLSKYRRIDLEKRDAYKDLLKKLK